MTAPINPTDIVFLGDSLTEGFDLQHYFKIPNIKNRGLSGDTTYEVRYRLEEIVNAKPARLFLMIGINDFLQGEDEITILNNISLILEEFRQKSPATELFVQSLLPVNETVLLSDENLNLYIFSINDNLRHLCHKLSIRYLDLYTDFLNSQGQLDSKYTYDGLHLSPEGYDLWAKLISPLTRL
jgi:lysophospholipase L1-like esterase